MKWTHWLALAIAGAATIACSSSSSDAGAPGGSAGTGALAPTLGALCAKSSDCAAGLTCDDASVPTATMCSAACASDADCTRSFGANAMCIGANRCVVSCRSDADCASDHVCNEERWCVRKTCTSDDQCWSYVCDPGTKQCKTDCVSDADCQPGLVCGHATTTGICYRP